MPQKFDPWPIMSAISHAIPHARDGSRGDILRPIKGGGRYGYHYAYDRPSNTRERERSSQGHGDHVHWEEVAQHQTGADLPSGKVHRRSRDRGGNVRDNKHQSRRHHRQSAHDDRIAQSPPPARSPTKAEAIRRDAAANIIMSIHTSLRSDGMAERDITDFFRDAIIEARRRH